jgi:hypothetical protein
VVLLLQRRHVVFGIIGFHSERSHLLQELLVDAIVLFLDGL